MIDPELDRLAAHEAIDLANTLGCDIGTDIAPLRERLRLIHELGVVVDKKHRFAFRMAELLRELEWSGCQSYLYDGCTSACPSCGEESRFESTVPPHTGINRTAEPMTIVHREGKHKDDCKLATILAEWSAS